MALHSKDKRAQRRAQKRKRRTEDVRADKAKAAFRERYEAAVANAKRRGQAARSELEKLPDDIRTRALRSSFPSSYAELRARRHPPYSGSPETELDWLSEVLAQAAPQLSVWASLERTLLRAMLRADYQLAKETHETIKARCGASIWAAETEVLISELAGGLSANRDSLAQIVDDLPAPISRLLVTFASERAERNLSASNYTNGVDAFLRKIPLGPGHAETVAYIQFITNSTAAAPRQHLGFVLWHSQTEATIDTFRAACRAMSILYARQEQDEAARLRDTISKLRAIPYRRLATLDSITNKTRPSDPLTVRALAVADLYTTGNYSAALESAEACLRENPECFELHELWTRSSLFLGGHHPSPFAPTSLASELLLSLRDVFSRGAAANNGFRILRKLALQLQPFELSEQILSFIASQDGLSDESLPTQRYVAATAAVLTPRIAAGISRGDAEGLLGILTDLGGQASVRLFRAVVAGNLGEDRMPDIPRHRVLKYRALALMQASHPVDAVPLYQELLELHPRLSMTESAGLAGLYGAYIKSERLQDAVRLFVDALLERPEVATVLKPGAVIQALASRPAPTGIDWPIVCALHFGTRGSTRAIEPVYAAYDRFLLERGVSRPSELFATSASPDDPRLLLFLRTVCSLDIMDNDVLAFGNTSELHAERLLILRHLLAYDAAHSDEYGQEVSQIIQADTVSAAIKRLGDNKIFVDTAGIKNSLGRDIRERYERYVSFSRLSERLRESYQIPVSEMRLDAETIVLSDAGRQQFEELFGELRDRFVNSSDFGLDFYLSVRIRHGTFSGQLRAPFEAEHLITRRLPSGEYAPNQHWRARIAVHRSPLDIARTDELFKKFSTEIDATIEEARSSWIQVKTSTTPTGLFDYSYSDESMLLQYIQSSLSSDFDEFIETVFDSLLKRTDECLHVARERLAVVLRDRLSAALGRLAEGLREVVPEVHELQAALARCGTQLQHEVDIVVRWFGSVAEQAMPEYSLRLVFDTAAAIIKYCNPNSRFTVTVSGDDLVCQGASFAPLVDVFLTLFDNVVRHSGVSAPNARVSVSVSSNRIVIMTINALGKAVDRDRLRRTSEAINAEPTAELGAASAKKEGGSGYAKVHRLVRHALACGSSYQIRTSANGDDFEAAIELPRTVVAK